MGAHTRDELAAITAKFLEAFNRNDLDGVMAHFAPNGVYEEFNGNLVEGPDAVRAAFAPQFSGAFGELKFIDEDLMVDAEAGKVMASWRCTLEVKGEPTGWRGLDAMTFDDDGKITHKLTYAKTRAPLFGS
ncbi:MAG: nuclear transport factor 2 family protein [Actinomycetia bacterium]|nr:nuclear transport factor 2 family protein [Actinomycetes bacterium]